MSPFLFIYYTMFLIFKKEKVSISENSYQHTPEEKEKCTKADFDIMKQWKLLPKEVTYEDWMRRGRPLNWEST